MRQSIIVARETKFHPGMYAAEHNTSVLKRGLEQASAKSIENSVRDKTNRARPLKEKVRFFVDFSVPFV
jgi:hypothetical protein